jgi:hypothetical protein
MPQKQERIKAGGERVEAQPKARKPYTKPKIIHELELETRAGSLDPPAYFGEIPGLEPPIGAPKK